MSPRDHGFPCVCVAVAFALLTSASAQVPAPPAGIVLMNPKGSTAGWAGKSDGLLLKSDVATKSMTVEEVLKDNGFAYDDKTKRMFEQLNPKVKASDSIKAGTKFDLIAVDDPSRDAIKKDNALLMFQRTDPVTAYSENMAAAATKHREMADGYTTKAYVAASYQRTHVQSLRTLEEAGAAFRGNSNKLTGLEYGIAADRLDYANRKAAAIDTEISTTGAISAQKISMLESATKLLEPLKTQEKLTRRVKIVVTDQENKPVRGLTVYSLPGPFFDDPDAYPESFIRSRLIRYSFPEETSPSSADVDGIDARVWVGPKRRFEEMVQLVKQHKLAGKYSTLNEMTMGKGDVEIRLASPQDIVSLP